MIQILLNRMISLDGLKSDIEQDLLRLKNKDHNEFHEVSTTLFYFINVYKGILSRFIHGEREEITAENYQEQMKEYDDKLIFLCNHFTFLKSELLAGQNGQK